MQALAYTIYSCVLLPWTIAPAVVLLVVIGAFVYRTIHYLRDIKRIEAGCTYRSSFIVLPCYLYNLMNIMHACMHA